MKHLIRSFQSLSLPVSIEDALAIDSENFESPDANAWYVACSFYPKELDNVAHVKELESRLKRSKRVRFMQTDLLEAGLPEPFFGAFQRCNSEHNVISAYTRESAKDS